jgi:hypothetical protein
MAAYVKDGQTGALSAVPGSPFPDGLPGGVMAVDALGRFLFVANTSASNISMFQIDQSTGNLLEVPGSPFSSGPTENPNMAPTLPVCLTVEKSGQFLYVGYHFGNFPNQGAINEYLIDATNRQLVPLSAQPTVDIASVPIGVLADPRGVHLYIGLGANPSTGVQAVPPLPHAPRLPPFVWLYLVSLLVCCAVFVLYAYKARRLHIAQGWLRAAAIAIITSCCLFQVAGCGGGGAAVSPQAIPAPHTSGTPQGTSTITLTPSVTTSTGTPLQGVPPIQLTLIVQ